MPYEGEPNSEYPGCVWSNRAQDWACDDGYYLNSGLAIPDGGLTTYNPFGGSGGGQTVVVNDHTYVLPPGVPAPDEWNTSGWYVWSSVKQEQWVVSLGGRRVGGTTPTIRELQQQQQQGEPSDEQVSQWRQEQEALNAARTPGGVDLETLKQLARAGGAAAEGALKTLAANGDLIAKLAIMLGIGYAAAAIIPWAGGGVVVLAFLFKRK